MILATLFPNTPSLLPKNLSPLIFKFSYFLPFEWPAQCYYQESSAVSRVFLNFIRKFSCEFDELSSTENRVERSSLIFPPPRANNQLPSSRAHQTFTAISFLPASANRIAPEYFCSSDDTTWDAKLLSKIRQVWNVTLIRYFPLVRA